MVRVEKMHWVNDIFYPLFISDVFRFDVRDMFNEACSIILCIIGRLICNYKRCHQPTTFDSGLTITTNPSSMLESRESY